MSIRRIRAAILLTFACLGASLATALDVSPQNGNTPADLDADAGLRLAEFARDNQLPLAPNLGNRLTVIHEKKADRGGGGKVGGGDGVEGSDYYSQAKSVKSDSAHAFIVSNQFVDNPLPEENVDRIWLGGVGAWSKQKDRGDELGYKYNAYGLTGGYDWERGDFTLGVFGGYAKGKMKGNDGTSRNDVDHMQVGAYASYDPVSGVFADANVSAGRSKNQIADTDLVDAITGNFTNTNVSAGLNMGYTIQRGDLRITPTLGVQWTHVKQGAWTEDNAAGDGTRYEANGNDYVEFPLAVRVNKAYQLQNGMVLTPEVRAAYIFNAGDNAATVRTIQPDLNGVDTTYTLTGINPNNGRGLVGAGVKANLNRSFDAYLDYNYEVQSGFSKSNLNTGVGVSF